VPFTIISVTFASVVPIIGIVYFARSHELDYDIPERSARATPFVFATVSYLFGFVILVFVRAPVLLTGLMLAYLINTSVMFLVSLSWKISVHAAGVTGPLSFLVFRLGVLWSPLYAIAVPVGLIRLRLRQHTLPQILVGAVLSAALTWAWIIFLVPIIPA
jgi:membrane-associated phospholipid phosphatase